MSILFSANISEKHQDRLKTNFPKQTFIFSKNINNAIINLKDATILVTYGEDLDAKIIEQAVNLKWIMVLSAGLERMPFEVIAKKGILVTNVRGIHKVPMAEYAISMLLQVYRQEKLLLQNQAKSEWDKSVRMQELNSKTLLVIGTGAIGQEVARLAKAFYMTTLGISKSGKTVEYFDRNYPITELNTVLSEADFIVSVLPSTPETKEIFTLKQFEKMNDHAVFLNMGRGDAVVEEDLLKAIKQQKIAHAVLDVFIEEPLNENHPFWEEENITITPHISAQSSNYVPRALDIFEENLRAYLKGNNNFINEIDLKRGY